jgi:predicted CopG family antitoxin
MITKGQNHEHRSSWTRRFCSTWIVLWLFYYISFAIHQSSCDRQDSVSSSDGILRYTKKEKFHRINILKLMITKGRNHEHRSSWTQIFCSTWIVLWLFYYISFAIHQLFCDRQDSVSSSDGILRYAKKRKRPINVCCTAVSSWTFWEGYKGGESLCHRLPHDVEINDVLQTRLYSVHTLIQPTDRAHEPRSLFN